MMRERRLQRLWLVISFLLLIMCPVWVQASVENVSSADKVSSTSVWKGDTLSYTLSLRDYTDIGDGINVIKGTFVYDQNNFGRLHAEDFKMLNSWENFFYNEETGEFIAIKRKGSREPEDIFQVTLRSAENLGAGETYVGVKEISVSQGNDDIFPADALAKIDLISDTAGDNTTGNGEQAPNQDNGGNDTISGETPADSGTDSDTSSGQGGFGGKTEAGNRRGSKSGQVRTGDTSKVMFYLAVLCVSVLIILGIGSKIVLSGSAPVGEETSEKVSRRMWKRRGEVFRRFRFVLLAVLVLLLVMMAAINAYTVHRKGELNGDGIIDDADVILLEKHLVSLGQLSEEQQRTADMNSDGWLTVTDVSLLLKKAEGSTDYTVTLESAMESTRAEKGDEIVLRFYGQSEPAAEIDQVIINGKVYDAKLQQDTEYTVTLPAAGEAGKKEYKISRVILADGEEVNTDFTQTIEVLKAPAEITDFRARQQGNTEKMKISFSIKDEDNAVTSAGMQVSEECSSEVVKEETAKVGENEFTLDLKDGEVCTLHIFADYRRDFGETGEEEETGTAMLEKTVQINLDYQFAFKDLKLYSEDMEEITEIARKEKFYLGFVSSNQSEYKAERIMVNGASYPVTEKDGIYVAEMPAASQAGKETLTVGEVILENGKTFTLHEDNTVNLTVRKAEPEVQNVEISESPDKLRVQFTLKDEDGALSDTRILVKDGKGKVIFEKEITPGAVDESFSLGDLVTDAYQMEVTADYDAGGSEGAAAGKVICRKEFAARPRVVVKEVSADKPEVEAGENVTLTCRFNHNQKEEVTKVVINNRILPVKKQEDGSYEVSCPISEMFSDGAGKKTLELTYVLFGDTGNTKVETSSQLEIEILKAVPSVTDFETTDDFAKDQVQVRFHIKDTDQALISGYAELTDEDGRQAAEEKITAAGEQNFTFKVEEETIYNLKIYLTYARNADKSQKEENKLVEEIPIQLLKDYDLKIENLETGRQYFEKNEEIPVSFTGTTDSAYAIVFVKVDGKAYAVEQKNDKHYSFTLPGYQASGVKTIQITDVEMENGKELTVQGGAPTKIEVLKTAPAVENFTSAQTGEDEMKITFNVTDPDDALLAGTVQVKTDVEEIMSKAIARGENTLTFALTSAEDYNVRIVADYDRDSNGLTDSDNEIQNAVLLEEKISVVRDAIEIKDITEIRLYKKTADGAEEVTKVDLQAGTPDPKDYYAVIRSENLPELYTNIREFRLDEDAKTLRVAADQESLIQRENGAKKNEFTFTIAYTDQDGTHTPVKSAEEFFEAMGQDLSGTFELKEDLDASAIPAGKAAVPGTFKGKLIGNGHKILNLHTSLFETVSGGTIENLILEDAQITSGAKGVLANEINENSVVQQVFVVDSVISNTASNMVGGFAGNLNGSVTKESAAINVSLTANNTIGGMYGQTNASAVIQDCYVTGTLKGTLSHSLGSRTGGFVGWHNGKLERVYAKVQISSPNKYGSGGLVGGPDNGQPVMKDAFVMTDGNVQRIAGFSIFGNAGTENLYEYEGSSAATNKTDSTGDKIQEVTDETLRIKTFYKDKLGFDENIWNLDLVADGKLPSLQADPASKNLEDYEIEENASQIPGYAEVRKNDAYQSDRETAYKNLSMLLPYADTAAWVEQGNALDGGSNLVQKKIDKILPLAEDGSLVSGLTDENLKAVSKVRILYTDGTVDQCNTTYKKTIGRLVAAYEVEGSFAGYQFAKYVAKPDEAWLGQLAAKAAAWSYEEIAAFTPETESRLYRDYYDTNVKDNLEKILKKLISSQEQYPSYLENETVEKLWKGELEDEAYLKKLLYAYNYYDKWYHINFNGVTLSDLLYFSGTILSPDMTAENLTQDLENAGETNRKTEGNYDYYTNVLQKKYTSRELMEFLEDMVYGLTDYDSPSDWFAGEFKGAFLERQINSETHHPKYRVWDVMSNLGTRKKIVLPILSAPEEAQEEMYLICMPTQFVMGSMNGYDEYHTGGRQKIESMMKNLSEMVANFYGVTVDWVPDGEEILSSFTNIHYDSIMNFPAHGDITGGTQVSGQTSDPVLKWIFEAVGEMRTSSGYVGAFANGNDMFWILSRALNSGSYLFTHETTHNQEGKYFYNGYGRRSYTGPEAHTDGNITQFGSLEGENHRSVFNLIYDGSPNMDIATNFTYKTIDTQETVGKYYEGMFETRYVLDYLAAQAFLSLTPQEQARVAVQVKENKDSDGYGMSAEFVAVSEAEMEAMNLKDMEDLWENKLMWRTSTGSSASARGGNADHRGSFYDMPWYQAHNDTGTGDSESFKRLGQEMLGYAGYVDGYIRFMSDYVQKEEGKLPTDLAVIQSITGDSSMTWKKYKLGRFRKVEDNLDKITYFDPNVVQAEFKAAFEDDAANGKRGGGEAERVERLWYGVVKRATNDFAKGDIYGNTSVTVVNSAQELIDAIENNPMGTYRLGQDLDFGSIDADGVYINGSFYGVLDGDGHKLTNVHSGLWKDAKYVHVKDLTIENPEYKGASRAILAESGKNIILSNVIVTNADTNLPFVLTKKDTYREYNCQINYLETTINSVEDFMKMAESDANLRKDYVLGADLDFTGQKTDGLCVLNTTFYGSIDGKGHTIKGLPGTLFKKIQGGTIQNVRIADSSLIDFDIKGSLAETADGTTLKNIQLDNVAVRAEVDAGKYNVGGLIGSFTNGTASQIVTTGIFVEGSASVGGIFGNTEYSEIKDVLVQGTVSARYYNYNTGNDVGGVAGNANTVTFENIYSRADVAQRYGSTVKGIGSGGIVGGNVNKGDTVIIRDSVSASTGAYSYRIADPRLLVNADNVYELEGSSAMTNVTADNQGRIHAAAQDLLHSAAFYRDTLGWPETIWDFSKVTDTGIPILRFADAPSQYLFLDEEDYTSKDNREEEKTTSGDEQKTEEDTEAPDPEEKTETDTETPSESEKEKETGTEKDPEEETGTDAPTEETTGSKEEPGTGETGTENTAEEPESSRKEPSGETPADTPEVKPGQKTETGRETTTTAETRERTE